MSSFDHILDYLFEHRVLTHVLYWLVFFLFSCFYGLGQGEPFLVSVFLEFVFLPIQIMASYVFMYFQIPLIAKKKYLAFICSIFIFGYIFYVLLHINNDYGLGTYLISGHQQHSFLEILMDGTYVTRFLADVYLVVFLTTGIKLIKNQIENKRLLESIQAEKIKSEYNLLQSKIQPTFLMNALQHIQKKSKTDIESTPETIAQLSEVLDYSLYQSRQEKIPIAKEIEACITYLSLFQKSSDYKKSFVITHDGTSQLSIVPLTLIHYVDAILQAIDFKAIQDFEANFIQDLKGVDFTIQYKNEHPEMTGFPLPQKQIDASLLQVHYEHNYSIEIKNKSVTSIQLKLQCE